MHNIIDTLCSDDWRKAAKHAMIARMKWFIHGMFGWLPRPI